MRIDNEGWRDSPGALYQILTFHTLVLLLARSFFGLLRRPRRPRRNFSSRNFTLSFILKPEASSRFAPSFDRRKIIYRDLTGSAGCNFIAIRDSRRTELGTRNSERCFMRGMKAAWKIIGSKKSDASWSRLRKSKVTWRRRVGGDSELEWNLLFPRAHLLMKIASNICSNERLARYITRCAPRSPPCDLLRIMPGHYRVCASRGASHHVHQGAIIKKKGV